MELLYPSLIKEKCLPRKFVPLKLNEFFILIDCHQGYFVSPRYVRTLKGGEEHAHRPHDERPRPCTHVEDDGFPSRGGTRYQIL